MKASVGSLEPNNFKLRHGQGYEEGSNLYIENIALHIQPQLAKAGYIIESRRDLHKKHPGVDLFMDWSDMESRAEGKSGNVQIIYPMGDMASLGKRFMTFYVTKQEIITQYHKAQHRVPFKQRFKGITESEIIEKNVPLLDAGNLYCYIQIGDHSFMLIRYGDYSFEKWRATWRSKPGKLDTIYIHPNYLIGTIQPISHLKKCLDHIYRK